MIQLSKPYIGEEEMEAVAAVLKSGHLAQGEEVKKLEDAFAKLCGAKYAVAVVNGTAALHSALAAAGIQAGDEVIATPFTFVATANAVLMTGAVPVFADVKEDTFNIDPEDVEKKITARTKAILAVDLYGQPADYEELRALAKKHDLIIIEDAAQSVGATYKGKPTGSLGDIGCFSLYATKNIMSGEGGMLTTDNKDYADRARMFRSHGQTERRYEYAMLGYNYRMTDVLASIARVQLTRLADFTKKRQEHAAFYSQKLAGVQGIVTPVTAPDRTHVFHQYTLRVSGGGTMSRDEIIGHLHKKGIQSAVYYPQSLTGVPHFNATGDCPIADRLTREVFSIPVHPFLTTEETGYIVDTLTAL